MSATTTYSAFRLQMYRLAWLMTFSVYGVVVLMCVAGHGRTDGLPETGFGLFLGVSLFSILARRFAPFAWGLLGLLLLPMCMCA
jgi:hypothetical protein